MRKPKFLSLSSGHCFKVWSNFSRLEPFWLDFPRGSCAPKAYRASLPAALPGMAQAAASSNLGLRLFGPGETSDGPGETSDGAWKSGISSQTRKHLKHQDGIKASCGNVSL